MKRYLLTITLLLSLGFAMAQKHAKAPDNWFNLDPREDKVYGVSTERAYRELLKNKTANTIVVAVIDGGADIYHEDLKDVIWTNPAEIPGNGVDDDHNGYVDDIHGWNYIGSSDPNVNVKEDTYEITRLYAKDKKRFDRVPADRLGEQKKREYLEHLRYKEAYDKAVKPYKGQYSVFTEIDKSILRLCNNIGNENPSLADVKAYTPKNELEKETQKIVVQFLSKGTTIKEVHQQLMDQFKYYEKYLSYHYNLDFDTRRDIVKDDYNNVNDIKYGNNNVKGPSAGHGSHVAGIIAAVRNNNIGMNGVASNVRIMVLRVVPDGDERDKDVANAIRYAADNGARVVNMSFGKGWSWNKKAVDEAVRYAMQKDVLLVHAAGNSSLNLESNDNFPNPKFEDNGVAGNWIEVGASSWQKGKKLTARFSNYGPTRVDVFAPGVDIYSTVPDTNKYAVYQGTSMAAPVTAGVAALIRSYYPQLKAPQVKEIIVKSVTPVRKKVLVPRPHEVGRKKKVKLKKLCVSGGVVNAYNALKLAESYK